MSSLSTTTLGLYGLAGGVGLLVATWAAQAYLWYGYQRANPAVGSVSTTPGFEIVIAALFVAGVAAAFTAFARGIARATGGERR